MTDRPSLDLVYDETKGKLALQISNLRGLDAKATLIAGLTAVVLGLVVNRLPIASDCALPGLWVAAVSLLFVAEVTTLLSLWIVGWRADPSPAGMLTYLTVPEADSKRQFLANYVDSYSKNRKRLNRKMWWIRAAMLSLLLGLGLAAVAVLASCVHQGG